MSTPASEVEAVSAAAAETGCCFPAQAGTKRAAKSHKGRRQMDDDFMIRLYKIKLCTRTTPHNWKLCPWAHPGETAALRRDPSSHMAEMCPAVRQHQECPHGEGCLYARNTFECWLHPNRYRTTMCSSGEACNRNICFFAHNEQELRAPAPEVAQLWAGPGASAGADTQQLLLQDMSPAQAQQLVMGPAAAGASGPLAGLMPGGTDMPSTGAGCGLCPATSFSTPLFAPSPPQAPWCAVVAPGSSTPLVAAAASPQAQQLQLQHALIQHQQLQAAGLTAPAEVVPASAPRPGLMYVPACAGMSAWGQDSSARAKQYSPAAPTYDVLATAGVLPEQAAARRSSSNGLAALNSAGPSPGNSASKLPCLQPVAAADPYALQQAAVMQHAALLLQQLQLSGVMGHASCPQPSTDSLQSLLLGSSGTLPGLSHLSLSELSGEDNLTAFLPGSYPVTQDLPGVQAGRTAAALMQDTCLLPLESGGLIQLSALDDGPAGMAQHQQQVTLGMQQPNRFW